MGSRARIAIVGLVVGILVGLVSPAAQAAPGISNFFAANCTTSTCAKVLGETANEELEHAKNEGFTVAGGHPNYGITDFTVNTKKEGSVLVPEELVTHVRTDVSPGVSTDPQAVPKCTFAAFDGGREGEAVPGSNLYAKPTCAEGEKEKGTSSSVIGVNKVKIFAGAAGDQELTGTVYNLVQPKGLASDFGVALKLPTFLTKPGLVKALEEKYKLTEAEIEGNAELKAIVNGQYYAHTLIEGNVEWGAEAAGTGKADYHDFFNINVSPELPLISSRLIFNGRAGNGTFLTNPTVCPEGGDTTKLGLQFLGGGSAETTYTTLVPVKECGKVPFAPEFELAPNTLSPDVPDGVTAILKLPHAVPPIEKEEEVDAVDSAQVKTATVTLPPGLTLNPSAANGLEACTPKQVGIGTKNPVECPEGSRLGTVTLNVPGLPQGSLTGYIYLGGPESGPITGPPYTTYVVAESEHYGVSVRLKGETVPNEETGQLTTTFKENPEQPFSELALHFNGGPLAPLANGLFCEASTANATFAPYTMTTAVTDQSNFEIKGCPSSTPFTPTQSTTNETTTAGGTTSYGFNLARTDGQQYIEKVKTTLPEGLVGQIPKVALCGEPQANEGTCGASSRIGTATVTAGAGRIPFTFSGPVYMTSSYAGAPYGLSVAVPAVAGPFNLGIVVTRATVKVNPITAQVEVEAKLPTIVKGVPLRLKTISVNVDRQGFLLNPTSCSPLETASLISSVKSAASVTLNSGLQLGECGALGFKPSFQVSTGGKPSSKLGASLTTEIKPRPGDANIKSVFVTLPQALPSRQSTLKKACLQATFEANPDGCGEETIVGTATAVTPTLPEPLTGNAVLVSHGGAEFPNLELVLESKAGVRVILSGKTDIKKGITTSNFATNPDVPISSFRLELPMGPHSLLGAYGNLCTAKLLMPTVITGQNGTVFKQTTNITTTGCGVQIIGRKVIGNRLFLTVKTFSAGRITATGPGFRTTSRSLGSATAVASLVVPITYRGRAFYSRVKVTFRPRSGSGSSATTTARIR